MTKNELHEIIETQHEHNVEIFNKHKENIMKELNVEVKESDVMKMSYFEMDVHVDNMKYIKSVRHYPAYASVHKTDLAFELELNDELGWVYQQIELPYEIAVVRWLEGFTITTIHRYHKKYGKAVKGKRTHLSVKANSKGSFITIENKRYYLEGC